VKVVVVVGNPKLRSRTRKAGELVAERLAGHPPTATIELAELGPALLGPRDGTGGGARAAERAADAAARAVEAAKQTVRDADLVVFASPTFKATYSGLLKLFLDQFAAGELANTPAVALMLGAAPQHALAGEHTLKPVLSEIGCSCPAPALFLLESDWAQSPTLEAWLARAAGAYPRPTPGDPEHVVIS